MILVAKARQGGELAGNVGVFPGEDRTPGLGHYLCQKCQEVKEESEFWLVRRVEGLKIRSYCKRCMLGPVWQPRTCKRCGLTKSVDQFGQRSRTCKQCASQSGRYKRLKETRPDLLARDRERLLYRKRFYKIAASNDPWGLIRLAKHMQRQTREYQRFLRKRRRISPSLGYVRDLTLEQWNAIVQEFEGKCAYCGNVPERLEIDHVVPVSRGGDHTWTNVLPSCVSCNRSKHCKDLAQWLGVVDFQLTAGTAVLTCTAS